MKFVLFLFPFFTTLILFSQEKEESEYLIEAKKCINIHNEAIQALGDTTLTKKEVLAKQKALLAITSSPYIRVPHNFTEDGKDSIISLSTYMRLLDETYPYFVSEVSFNKMKFEDLHIDTTRNTYRVIARVRKKFIYPVFTSDTIVSVTSDTTLLADSLTTQISIDSTFEISTKTTLITKPVLLSYYFSTKIMFGEHEPLKLEAIQVKFKQPVYKTKLTPLSAWWIGLSPAWKKKVKSLIKLPELPTEYYLERVQSIKKIDLKGIKKDDLHVLSQFSGIEQLDLSNLDLDTLFDLTSFKNLKILSLAKNNLSSIETLKGCTALQSLNISDNELGNINALAKCTKLMALSFNNNQIEDISVLKNFPHLRTLNFSNNKVDDISVLRNCRGIKNLNISKNKEIKSLEPLRNTLVMQNLNCFNTNVENLDPIKGMTGIHTLNVGFTKIKSMDPIKGFPNMLSLNISGCAIDDFSALNSFSKLTRFYCSQVKITDMSPFLKLRDLKEFTAVNTDFTKADIQRLKKKFPRCALTYY